MKLCWWFYFLKEFKYSIKYSRVYRQSLVLDPAVKQPECNSKKKKKGKKKNILQQLEGWLSVLQTGPGTGSVDTNQFALFLLGILFCQSG